MSVEPIRAAGPADGADMARLHADAFPGPWSEADLVDMLAAPGGFGLIAPGRGFLLGRALAGEAEILTLAVRPPARRSGLALALVAAAAGAARHRRASTLFLEVAGDNAAARALYDKAGFQARGLRRGYYARPSAPPVDALVLALDLESDVPLDRASRPA